MINHKPFSSKISRWSTICSELGFVVFTAVLFKLGKPIESYETERLLGWIMILLVSAPLGMSWIFMIIQQIVSWKERKMIKEMKEEQELLKKPQKEENKHDDINKESNDAIPGTSAVKNEVNNDTAANLIAKKKQAENALSSTSVSKTPNEVQPDNDIIITRHEKPELSFRKQSTNNIEEKKNDGTHGETTNITTSNPVKQSDKKTQKDSDDLSAVSSIVIKGVTIEPKHVEDSNSAGITVEIGDEATAVVEQPAISAHQEIDQNSMTSIYPARKEAAIKSKALLDILKKKSIPVSAANRASQGQKIKKKY